MSNPGLIKNQNAESDIAACRIVKAGASDGGVTLATAATDAIMGVNETISVKNGERIDVIKTGIADIEFGGAVTRGQPVTSDATGRAVVAAPAANANVRIIGFAEVSAVAGDIAPVMLSLGVMQG